MVSMKKDIINNYNKNNNKIKFRKLNNNNNKKNKISKKTQKPKDLFKIFKKKLILF